MGGSGSKADFYFDKPGRWQAEISALRAILAGMPLDEDLKWGVPCYTNDGRNIVLIHTFKAYCALLFFKGALFESHTDLLVQQTKNVQAARQLRFTGTTEIADRADAIRTLVNEAIEIETSGRKVDMITPDALVYPEEFVEKLAEMPELSVAFEALTPGRQRAYHLHFTGAKQSATRLARVEKAIPRILAGKGLDDR